MKNKIRKKYTLLASLFLSFIVFIFSSMSVPLFAASSNIFGMHLAQYNDEDVESIAQLVNSRGGDWGYITLIIQETDRDVDKWQGIFDKLKKLHLTPIIRIATQAEGDHWRRPDAHEAGEWAQFLDALEWPTSDRYVILFNEPNHASEWGGSVNPENYGEVARVFAQTLETRNSAFFVMIAAMDASAPSSPPSHEDQHTFYSRMLSRFPAGDFNTYISGLASHSYPNPGYRGKPTDTGRKSIRTYEWELQTLKSKGVKSLPVYITETGWPHSEPNGNTAYYDANTVAEYYRYAFQEVWFKDSRVRAVTPFTFTYPVSTFANFSWERPDGSSVYPQYTVIMNMPKIPGNYIPQGVARVYRFWSDTLQGHFYTINAEERDTVIAQYPTSVWRYEGTTYYSFLSQHADTFPIYRFWSDALQGHFYTINEEERNFVQTNYPKNVWKYEGVAYYAYLSPGTDRLPVYRFWSDVVGHHFYTASAEERDIVIETMSHVWRYEGVGWYVPR